MDLVKKASQKEENIFSLCNFCFTPFCEIKDEGEITAL